MKLPVYNFAGLIEVNITLMVVSFVIFLVPTLAVNVRLMNLRTSCSDCNRFKKKKYIIRK